MNTTRRDFLSALGGSAAAGLALGLNHPLFAMAKDPDARADRTLKVLILGGTGFLGPAVVEVAKKRGHTLTLFNRGKTRPELFPDVEKLRGDRKTDLKALEGRKWDVVLDNCGYVPRVVKASADLLKENVAHYIFISSISVYGETVRPNADETTPVGRIPNEDTEEVTGETYGPLKALCEQAAEKSMPGRVANIRPGLIVGPGDPTDRFTYWPVRVDRGGEVLCPNSPKEAIQVIDVRDLGAWIVRVMEEKTTGVFNATGPKGVLTMGQTLKACQDASKTASTLTWVDTAFLKASKVEAWQDMPAWVPCEGESEGFSKINIARAVAAGLTFRPIEATVRDTLAWWKTLPEDRRAKLRAGISPEREAEVLKAWHERKADHPAAAAPKEPAKSK
jgi:2'-hydroxyisoflavone reductase